MLGHNENQSLRGESLASGAPQRPGGTARPRLKPVVLVCAIMVATIISVLVAVISSAQRADTIALAHERTRLRQMVAYLDDSLLSELTNAATSSAAIRNIRDHFDRDWVDRRNGSTTGRRSAWRPRGARRGQARSSPRC